MGVRRELVDKGDQDKGDGKGVEKIMVGKVRYGKGSIRMIGFI